MATFKRNRDDSTTITVDGVGYTVPPGIEVMHDKADWFTDMVREHVEAAVGSVQDSLGLIRYGERAIKAGFSRRAGSLYVIVMDEVKGRVGWAVFRKGSGAWVEDLGALLPSHQRLGIYSALIRTIKQHEGPVVLSSQALIIANALRWMKTGAFDPDLRRYRANPQYPKVHTRAGGKKPSRTALNRAILSLMTRIYTNTTSRIQA